VEVPLRFDMKSFSTEIRDATEEIASKVGMEAYLADMACDVPFREAIRDLRQHSECYEGLLAFVGMVGDCFDQIFRMPEDDDEKQPLLKEMALKVSMKDALDDLLTNFTLTGIKIDFRDMVIHYPWINDDALKHYPSSFEDDYRGGILGEMAVSVPFSDALGHACSRVFPQSEEETADALQKTVSGTGELVRSVSQHRHTATCLSGVWCAAHCFANFFQICLTGSSSEPKVKSRGLDLPEPPPPVEDKRLFWKGQELQMSDDPSAWYCNSCFETYPNNHGVPHYRNAAYDYDICPTCLPKFLPQKPADPMEAMELEVARQRKRKADLDFELDRLKSLKRRGDELQLELANRSKDKDSLQKQVQYQHSLLEQQANGKAMADLQEARIAELIGELDSCRAESNECERRLAELEAMVSAREAEHIDLKEQHLERVSELQGHLSGRAEASMAYDLQAREVETLYAQKAQELESNYQKKLTAIGDNANQVRAAAKQLHEAHSTKHEQHAADTGTLVQACQRDLQDIERKRALHEAELNSLRARLGEVENHTMGHIEAVQSNFIANHQAAEAAHAEQTRQLQEAVALNSQRCADLEAKIMQLESSSGNFKQGTLADTSELANVQSLIADLRTALAVQEQRTKELTQVHEQEDRDLMAKIAAAEEQAAKQASSPPQSPSVPGTARVVEKFVRDSMDTHALSLEVGATVQILATKGPWATVKTASGQTGDVPVICLNMQEDSQAQAPLSPTGDVAAVKEEIQQVQRSLDMMRIDHTSRVVELETDVKTAKVVFDSLKRQLEMKTEIYQASKGSAVEPTRRITPGPELTSATPILTAPYTQPVAVDMQPAAMVPSKIPRASMTASPYPAKPREVTQLQAVTLPNLRAAGGSAALPLTGSMTLPQAGPGSVTLPQPGSLTLPTASGGRTTKTFTPNVAATTSKRVMQFQAERRPSMTYASHRGPA